MTGQELWDHAVEEHTLARRTNGTLTREAYATMWWGDTTSKAFDGLKTMLQSVRTFDATREFIIMTPVPEQQLASPPPVDANLLALQRAFPPVVIKHVPFLTIFNNPNTTCTSKVLGGCGMGTAKAYAGGKRPPKQTYDSYVYSYTKFALWNLTDYSKVFYIDNDVLVMQSLEGLWATPLGTRHIAAAALVIKARTNTGFPEAACDADGRIPKNLHPGRVKFNAGIHMMTPSAGLYAAIRRFMATQWRYSYKTPCTGDQRYWNSLLGHGRMHCWPMAANCRDPWFIKREAPPDMEWPVSRLSRCLESTQAHQNGTRVQMPVPYAVHMACDTKPWLEHMSKTFYAMEWRRQLAKANAKLGLAAPTETAPPSSLISIGRRT